MNARRAISFARALLEGSGHFSSVFVSSGLAGVLMFSVGSPTHHERKHNQSTTQTTCFQRKHGKRGWCRHLLLRILRTSLAKAAAMRPEQSMAFRAPIIYGPTWLQVSESKGSSLTGVSMKLDTWPNPDFSTIGTTKHEALNSKRQRRQTLNFTQFR